MNQKLEGIGRVEFLSVAVVIVAAATEADVVSGRNVSVVGGGGTSVVVSVG